MIIIKVSTDDLFRVIRKYEDKHAQLLSIQSTDEPRRYIVHYAIER